MTIKVLNLYAGIGGNRKLWEKVDVTAVEFNDQRANIYADFFPNDTVVIEDAHQYLVKHYNEYDFIWSSPPCPTHSRVRFATACSDHPVDHVYPDMTLYQEIIFLEKVFSGDYVVENVWSWYDPLITPQRVGKHYFWANFHIPKKDLPHENHMGTISELQKIKGFDLSDYDLTKEQKYKILRNCIPPDLGLHIFKAAFEQTQLTWGDML